MEVFSYLLGKSKGGGGGGGTEYHNEYTIDLDKETIVIEEDEMTGEIEDEDNYNMLYTYMQEVKDNPKGAKSIVKVKYNNSVSDAEECTSMTYYKIATEKVFVQWSDPVGSWEIVIYGSDDGFYISGAR